MITICSKCCVTMEHPYCMRTTQTFLEENIPWVCEECEEVIPDPTSLCTQNKVALGGLTTSGPSRSRYPFQKHVKPGKVKPISAEEVKKLSSGVELRTSKTTFTSNRVVAHKSSSVPVKENPRIDSGFAKTGRDGGRNINSTLSPSATRVPVKANPRIPSGFAKNGRGGERYLTFGPSTTRRSEVKMKKPSVTSSTPVLHQHQLIKDVGIKPLTTNAEDAMKPSQTSSTLVELNQQSHKEVMAEALHDGQQTEKASGTPLASAQNQNHMVKGKGSSSDSCASLGTKKLDVEAIASFVQKLRFYEPYFPAKSASWTGRCKILGHAIAKRGEVHEGPMVQLSHRLREAYSLSLECPMELQAHPASSIHRKAYELSLKMPVKLEVQLLPRSDIWTNLFHNDSPDLRDLALYIFPAVDVKSSEENYAKLLQCMEAEDLVIRTELDGFELLIFSSKHLHMDMQDIICYWSRKQFFWGIFRRVKPAVQAALPVPDNGGLDHDHSNIGYHKDVAMEVDTGGREVGPLDVVVQKNHDDDHSSFHDQEEVAMEVDMEGGKDLRPPEIVVRKDYSSKTVLQFDDGETADRTPSKHTTSTTASPSITMHSGSGKKTFDGAKEAAFPAGLGEHTSKKCKLEPTELPIPEKSANRLDVPSLINVKVEPHNLEVSNSVLWTPPPADWVKLNVAVSTSSDGTTTAAGIIRNRAAKWLIGYNINLGRTGIRSFQAEFQALLEGLKLAREGGFKKLVLEMESSAALESLTKNTPPHDPNFDLISRCKEQMRWKWECRLQVVSKEGNSSAHLLAQPFLCKPSGLSVLKDPPNDMNFFLQMDGMNT
ncbi:Putative ribonuclease H protein At1g65750 [Linum perenne]